MVNFILNGLNSSVGLDTSPQYPTNFASLEADISSAFIATIEVSKANVIAAGLTWSDFPINKTLFFKTTSPELTTSTSDNDMAFKCDSSMWPDISFSEAKVTSGKESVDVYSTGLKKPMENPTLVAHLSNDIRTTSYYRVNTIGPARLAFEITGGYNNSDIFSNEGELIAQYENLDSALKTQIISNLDAAGQAGVPGIGGADGAGGDGVAAGLGRKTNNDTGVDNISREVFLQLAANSFDRIRDQLAYHQGLVDNADNNYGYDIPMPLQAGDALQFTIKYKSNDADDPNNPGGNITYPGSNTIHDQIFKVTLNITQ